MSKMILIIEDEESIQNIIKAFLEDAGYTVVLAADGLEGIEQFRANKPDLVLLDLMLPKIDGFAVCEILRKESRVPIIMLTALDDDDSQMKGFDALADDYIIPCLIPLTMKGVKYRPMSSGKMLARNMLVYGLGGVVTPFIGINLIDLLIAPLLSCIGLGLYAERAFLKILFPLTM